MNQENDTASCFIDGGGECGFLTRSINWNNHSLGHPGNWPQSLLSCLSIALNSNFPMFIFWGPEHICFYNDAYRPTLGQTGKHPGAIGKCAAEVWPEIWDTIKPEIDHVLKSGEATWNEDRLLTILRNNKMDDVFWTYSSSPIKEMKGNIAGILVTCIETTRHILAQQNLLQVTRELQAKTEALIRSNNELEQFAQIASHDLKEPLRIVSRNMELLDSKYRGLLDDKGQRYVFQARDGAIRMLGLINELLIYAQAEFNQSEFEKVNVEKVLHEITALNRGIIMEKNAVILFDNLPDIIASKTPVKILLQNLIVNALKYQKKDIAPLIRIESTDSDSHWQFAVSDNGIGISEEYLSQVFESFRRLNSFPEVGGFGMGLAICKRIVNRHLGEIWVESEEAKGSTFYFTIAKNHSDAR